MFQPDAIELLTKGLLVGFVAQFLLGVFGPGPAADAREVQKCRLRRALGFFYGKLFVLSKGAVGLPAADGDPQGDADKDNEQHGRASGQRFSESNRSQRPR